MVDFNSEGAFTANKSHILELIILGRRDELINTYQLWKENSFANNSKAESLKLKVRSVLISLFLELDRALFRRLASADYELMKHDLLTEPVLSDDMLANYFFKINTELDSLNLIRIDTKKKYDTREIEAENQEKGL